MVGEKGQEGRWEEMDERVRTMFLLLLQSVLGLLDERHSRPQAVLGGESRSGDRMAKC